MSNSKEVDQPSASEADVGSEILSSLINVAGRQRMLSQRIVLQAMLAFHRFDGAIGVAGEALRLFSESHAALTQGRNGYPGLFSPAIRDAFCGVDNAGRKISDFIDLATTALEAIERHSARAESALHELIHTVDPLLNHLHRVTSVYEQEGRRISLAQKKGQRDLIEYEIRGKAMARAGLSRMDIKRLWCK